MTPTDDTKSTKRSWGQQLARLCCGELIGTDGDQPEAEYLEDTHTIRFHNGKGADQVDYPLDEQQPHDLSSHARALAGRYGNRVVDDRRE